jgi:hypothetical protein
MATRLPRLRSIIVFFTFFLHFPLLHIFEVLRNYRCEPTRDRWPVSAVGFVYCRLNLELDDGPTFDESED